MTLNELRDEIAEINEEKGWTTTGRSFGDQMALIHTEVSESFEEYRNGRAPDVTYYTDGKPEGIPSELADIIVRVLDTAGEFGIDMDEIMTEKLAYNRTRPHRHGGKVV
jgi:NTP pyrophosphatase (non-canonical NTP hydrolase)